MCCKAEFSHPFFFNLCLSEAFLPPPEISMESHADDSYINTSSVNFNVVSSKISDYLSSINKFFQSYINPTNLTVSLFTSWTRKVNLEVDISIGGRCIPTVHNQKILGVVSDKYLCTSFFSITQGRNFQTSHNNGIRVACGFDQKKNTVDRLQETTTFPIHPSRL